MPIVYNKDGVPARGACQPTYIMSLLFETDSRPLAERQPGTDTWHLFVGGHYSRAYNMALDEALLDSVIAGGQPVVRLYTWEPATLSLGVNQPLGEVDAEECARRGFGLVRRLTGGRAVLHQYELTYSVVAPENDPR